MINISDLSKVNSYLNDSINKINKLKDIRVTVESLKDELKSIEYKDIVIHQEDQTKPKYEIRPPESTLQLYNELEDKIAQLDNDYNSAGIIALHGSLERKGIILEARIDERINIIGDGLSYNFRGLGFGYKAYKKVIYYFGRLSTEENESYVNTRNI